MSFFCAEATPLPPARVGSRGFSLIEVTIALGVAGFCLLAILGLLQTGLTSERDTVEKTVATGILSSVYNDLASVPETNTLSPSFRLDLANTSQVQVRWFTEEGATNASASGSRYRAATAISKGTGKSPTVTRIVVSWPAMADAAASGWPAAHSGQVEITTALDRN